MTLALARHRQRSKCVDPRSSSSSFAPSHSCWASMDVAIDPEASTACSSRAPSFPPSSLEALRAAWNPGNQQRRGSVGRAPSRSDDARSEQLQGRSKARLGWLFSRGRWHFCEPGKPVLRRRLLTTDALREHDAAHGHSAFCRCHECFGSLDCPKPDTNDGPKADALSRQNKTRGDYLALVPAQSKNKARTTEDWMKGLGSTEKIVRQLTLPTQHALANESADKHGRSTAKAGTATLARISEELPPSAIGLNDLPRCGEFESWEEKWARELKFLDLQAAVRKRRRSESIVSGGGDDSASCISSFSQRSALLGTAHSNNRPTSQRDIINSQSQWASYDAVWTRREGGLHPPQKLQHVEDVAWPPMFDVCGFRPEDSPSQRKRKLHNALRRWHPDKWHQALESSPQQMEFATRLAKVTQQILSEKKQACL